MARIRSFVLLDLVATMFGNSIKPDSPELKSMAYASYPLTLSLKPYEPVDTTDTQYLNQIYTPLDHPLKRALHIEV